MAKLIPVKLVPCLDSEAVLKALATHKVVSWDCTAKQVAVVRSLVSVKRKDCSLQVRPGPDGTWNFLLKPTPPKVVAPRKKA